MRMWGRCLNNLCSVLSKTFSFASSSSGQKNRKDLPSPQTNKSPQTVISAVTEEARNYRAVYVYITRFSIFARFHVTTGTYSESIKIAWSGCPASYIRRTSNFYYYYDYDYYCLIRPDREGEGGFGSIVYILLPLGIIWGLVNHLVHSFMHRRPLFFLILILLRWIWGEDRKNVGDLWPPSLSRSRTHIILYDTIFLVNSHRREKLSIFLPCNGEMLNSFWEINPIPSARPGVLQRDLISVEACIL